MSREFLSAEWRYLAMLNYRVPAEWLTPFVPVGTELDLWDGAAYLSLVGFHFRNTRLLGVPIPFHQTFEEVNLRFYVRRTLNAKCDEASRSFVSSSHGRPSRSSHGPELYNEPYRTLSMRHRSNRVARTRRRRLVGMSGGPLRLDSSPRRARRCLHTDRARNGGRNSSRNISGVTRASVTGRQSSTRCGIRRGASGSCASLISMMTAIR